MVYESRLLSAPYWWKWIVKTVTGQSGREYYVVWDFENIAYEDTQHAVVISAEQLSGTPTRSLSRLLAREARGTEWVPVSDDTWKLVSKRVCDELTRRKVSWRME